MITSLCEQTIVKTIKTKIYLFVCFKFTTLWIIIIGIIKVGPANQQLYYKDEIMDETKTLTECGLNSSIAKAQSPATIGLAVR